MTHVTDERLGRFACQQADLFRRVREGSVDMEYASRGVQLIIEHKLPEPESQIFTLEVNYSQSLEEALRAGNYDWVDEELTSEHFPPTRSGIETVELHLIHFGFQMTSNEAKRTLEIWGLRFAIIEELLALGVIYPGLQRQFPIVALGSVWTDSDANGQVPALWGHDRARSANLHWFESIWSSFYRFAAVSK